MESRFLGLGVLSHNNKKNKQNKPHITAGPAGARIILILCGLFGFWLFAIYTKGEKLSTGRGLDKVKFLREY